MPALLSPPHDLLTPQLLPGEHLVTVAQIHEVVFGKAVVCGLGAVVLAWYGHFEAAFWAAIVAGFLYIWIEGRRVLTQIGLTDQRLLVAQYHGGFHLLDIPLSRIGAIEVEQLRPGSAFGTLLIHGGGMTRLRLENIRDPLLFCRAIEEQKSARHREAVPHEA